MTQRGIAYTLAAALLFGASTPFAKILSAQIPPVALAGLLYAGSGIGLGLWLGLRRLRGTGGEAPLRRAALPWLGLAILAGGVAGPVLLMMGLRQTGAAQASLLLNLEGVFTALLAWFAFRENFDRRIALGMGLIVAAGVLLSLPEGRMAVSPLGALLVAGACLAWAVDNNLTRKVSGGDPMQIAALKGLSAGAVNLAVGWPALAAAHPAWGWIGMAGVVGLLGYGLSLTLFVRALRDLGTARTGAYFSAAPFIGAALSLLVFPHWPSWSFWLAALLMGAGIWLHLAEHHTHEHRHQTMIHEHAHIHDLHHQHPHDFAWDGREPHSHRHAHEPLLHTHTHYPDLHHRHGHG